MDGFGVYNEAALTGRATGHARQVRKRKNGGYLLGLNLSSWQPTLLQNPGAKWPWGFHKPLSKPPHCIINLTPWHCVSKPHDLAQPTSPTLPPTATLHIPYLPIKIVFQFASYCSHPKCFPFCPRHPAQTMENATCPTKTPLALTTGTDHLPLYFYISPYSASICILDVFW